MSGKSENQINNSLTGRHPVITNILIIILVGALGICIVYFSIAIFTKHGQTDKVPGIENKSYTEAIQILHDHGFKVDIRDSLYKDNVRPGYVIEQFPKAGSIVKPGRKIFLYINAVHPKEVVIDDDNHPMEDALKSFSPRSGLARLQELGFKNVRVVKVLGDNDCIVKILANGVPVKKMQKVPVNASIVVQVYDGRLAEIRDSLQNEELMATRQEHLNAGETDYNFGYGGAPLYDPNAESKSSTGSYSSSSSSAPATQTVEEVEEIEYY
ncbi:MAG: PASTA domain-containing protein [Muribaculaceae bacterium]|nr:PASTA domain-containing protein [Muribaculaceae bacterium]